MCNVSYKTKNFHAEVAKGLRKDRQVSANFAWKKDNDGK